MFFNKPSSTNTFVPEIITKDWLDDLLKGQHTLTAGKVNSVVLRHRFLHHHSDLIFLQVNYSSDADQRLPDQWVLKVRTHFEGDAEIRFYHQAAKANRLDFLPRAGAFKSWPSGESVLLLESLKVTHRLVVTDDQVFNQQGWRPTGGILQQLVSTLAQFHARWWNHSELGALKTQPWNYDDILRKDVPSFKNSMQSAADLMELVNRSIADISLFLKRADASSVTLMHGDCFPWHFFRSREGGDMKLFDFEYSTVHSPAYDLVSLLCYWHGNYLKVFWQYHDALVAGQVTDYGFEELLSDIRLAVAAHTLRAVKDWHRGCSEALWKNKMMGLLKILQVVDNHKSPN